jgi:hypothetical protein
MYNQVILHAKNGVPVVKKGRFLQGFISAIYGGIFLQKKAEYVFWGQCAIGG